MASSFNLMSNPELERILRTTLPARRLLFIGGFALATVLVIAGFNWSHYVSNEYLRMDEQVKYASRGVYWALTLVLFGLLFVLAPAMTALSFVQEKLRGTAIFQQMILMHPFDIAVGKFMGSGAAGYFAAMIIMPFAVVAAILAEEKLEEVFALYLFLIAGGLSCQAVGLFISSVVSSPSDKGLRGGLLIGPATGALGAITALVWYRYFTDYRESTYYLWRFYGMDVEAYVVILALLLFVGVWSFAGAVRRVKAGQLMPLKPWPVWLFFATSEALLVGLFWGWRYNENGTGWSTPPITYLVFYLLLNWAALVILAGSIALSRQRLREWWSATSDALGLLQREEIRNNFKTFLIALGVAVAGLFALWVSYHEDAPDFEQGLALKQLLPITLCFVFTVLGTAAFVQYCSMQRFRARAWAGVGLAAAFYLLLGVGGALFKTEDNTLNLLNPVIYTYRVTRHDRYVDRYATLYEKYADEYKQARTFPPPDKSTVIIHGLFAESLLALGCFGLAFLKWRKLEDEMVEKQ